MRSVPIKTTKKTVKPANKKPVPARKKKMVDLKSPIRDTISETISFVIKGKLTPIKPIMIDGKLDLVTKAKKQPQKCGKVNKNRSCKKPAGNQIIKKPKDYSKVQLKTAKKPSAQLIKKSADKILPDVLPTAPKDKLKKNTKPAKKKPIAKIVNEKKPPIPKVKTQIAQAKKKVRKTPVRKLKLNQPEAEIKNNSNPEVPDPEFSERKIEDDIKKQQTIEKLLKQANEQLKSKNAKGKLKKINAKQRKDIKTAKNPPKEEEVKQNLEESKKSELNASPDYTSDEIPLNELSQRPSENTELPSQHSKTTSEGNVSETPQQPSPKRKIKADPKMALIKKRVLAAKNKLKSKEEKRKTKLYGIWNGPKRHRVASLNAIAKVHCLYENETRGNILDIIDESTAKTEYNPPKKESLKKEPKNPIKKEPVIKEESDEDMEDKISSEGAVTPPTRTLRCVPGLRAVGKHWDMHETSSSSEDTNSDNESVPVEIKKEKAPQQTPEPDKKQDETTKEKKRRRNRNEVIMDLKDMVVRKRMASLNASAILAASYSVEKRPARASKDADDSSSYESGSSEEYFAASDDDTKDDDVNKEDNSKLIEVHTTPNKKVAVILNQDTDVTITGVYVNSTTRSTHHEGYCSIAGMQYRISATSHTQTAATAVATETLLQSASSSSAPDNSNSDSLPSSKSYTPLDALSNMQPPPGPGIQHNHPVLHSQQHMGPPQHVLPIPPHQLSPGLRHGCSSAFSSPHSTPNYQLPPPGHHAPIQGEPGYVHGYYQPAGPLITVPHGHSQPPPPPITKSAPLSEASPTSTTPSASHDPPPPPSSNGDSSDSEVIITSVTTGKDSIPPPSHPPNSYRFTQYPTAPPGYSYSYPPPYHYPTPPPPNPSYAHHDLCYPPSPYVHHKYPSYRRYLPSTPYYPTNPQEIYPVPPAAPSQQSQQVVTTTPVSASGTTFSAPPSGPPPPTLMETYPAPQPTLVETYQPPPHYFSPAYGPAPPCYTHSPSRAMPYINATYQSCPCPMQSCPKNVLTGPLTGDSKRSNISSISKDSMPLPPVALALPLEPASATGPPSPARGSAGMPPPPSPAGATYQPPPPPTKQESHSPEAPEDCKIEKKRKARVGKAMVRSNMQQNTMLLMCNPSNYVSAVKREIESPKEKEVVEQKNEVCSSDEEIKVPVEETDPLNPGTKNDAFVKEQSEDPVEPKEEVTAAEEKEEADQKEISEEILQPIVNTVAENVKVKNMKRKLSMTKEKVPEPELAPSPRKKQRIGSYKYLIKRDTNTVKIHNGKRKLIEESSPQQKNEQMRKTKLQLKKPTTKRKLSTAKEINNKRLKLSKPLAVSNLHNNKQIFKARDKNSAEVISEVKEPIKKVVKKALTVNSKNSSKSAPAVLDSLFARNNVDRIIESVISESCLRTSKEASALKTVEKCAKAKEPAAQKKSTNKIGLKVKSDCKITGANRRKSKCKEVAVPQVITRIPRRSLHLPRWSNGWRWEGEPYEAKVFLNSDETTVVRKCYPAMRHEEGDKIFPRDCVLLKAGPKKNDLPFVAKIASLWENPEDKEMMMSLLWYYRPEHTEHGRSPADQPDEVFASRHKDSNSVACIDDKCYVLTFSEYCRYRKRFKRIEEGIEETLPCIPNPEPYPRSHRQPPTSQISPEMVFFCRRVYDFRQKRIMKNPT